MLFSVTYLYSPIFPKIRLKMPEHECILILGVFTYLLCTGVNRATRTLCHYDVLSRKRIYFRTGKWWTLTRVNAIHYIHII